MMARRRWYTWPIVGLWRAVSAFERRSGLLMTFLLGLGLIAFGVLLILTLAGVFVGVPMTVIGLFLVLRALY